MSKRSRRLARQSRPAIKAEAKPLYFTGGGVCSIKAEPGSDGKPSVPTFDGMAYTGQPMSPGGWGNPIICDLDGFEWADDGKHPVLHQHDPEQVVGHTTKITASKDGIAVSGVMSGEPENVNKIRGPASREFPWQMSVGATPRVTSFIEPGETATVNGREVVGPMTRSHKTKLSEISFVPNGADDQTSATVQGSHSKGAVMNEARQAFKAFIKSARALGLFKAGKYNDDEVDKMSEDDAKAALKKCMAADEPADDEEKKKAKAAEDEEKKAKAAADDDKKDEETKAKARRARIAAEEERHDMIRAAVRSSGVTHITIGDKKNVSLTAHAIAEGWAADKVKDTIELESLRASRASAEAGRNAGPHLHFSSEPLQNEAVIEAALFQGMRHQYRLNDDDFYSEATPDGKGQMRRVPKYLQDDAQKDFKAKYTEQVQDSAHRLYAGRLSCHQLFRDIFAANGSHLTLDLKSAAGIRSMMSEWDHMEKQAIRAAGTSTISIANILANVLNKFALQGYLYVEGAWRLFSSIRSFNDFKPTKSINLLGDVMYKDLGPNGEIDSASLGDQSFANQAAPYGRMITIPWTYIVNDDLSMLSTVPMKLGQGAGLKVNDVFWTLWAAMMNTSAVKGDDGVDFWRTSSATTPVAKKAGTAYLPNKTTGALSATSLSAVRALFENQIDPNGNPLGFDGMKPIILFGPSNWQGVTALMQAAAIVYGGASAALQPNVNVWQGYMTPVQSKYIENANYGNSTTAFFVLFDPVALPVIETGFLTGMDSPAVLTAGPDYQFDRLGISIRGTQAFGVKQQNFRGGVFCTGA